jgi:hypothetical protein
MLLETQVGLRVECLLLSEFNHIWKALTDFNTSGYKHIKFRIKPFSCSQIFKCRQAERQANINTLATSSSVCAITLNEITFLHSV